MLALAVATAATAASTATSATTTSVVTATLQVVFKSVTISASHVTFGNCTRGYSSSAALGFPNGSCRTGAVTVTNGAAPSTILVTGKDATPSDHGKTWALCGATGSPVCSVARPGVDQFSEHEGTVQLGLGATCDRSFAAAPCGSARSQQATAESLTLVGPTSSTDQSPTFTTDITWTAS